MADRIVVVRCPVCGSTDARGDDWMYEFTQMTCGTCGEQEWCDDWQIKMDWNTWVDPEGWTQLPPAIAPDVQLCQFGCEAVAPLKALAGIGKCTKCERCHVLADGGNTALDRTMSRALGLLARGKLTAAILGSLRQVDGFSWHTFSRAIGPDTDVGPVHDWIAAEREAERGAPAVLLDALRRHGLEGSA